ncbi:MAG TPA: hypothetical protein ENO24_04320 [Chloroflexi bacterium]|nr:hypothetical protein [Chloroflexota bacterium]
MRQHKALAVIIVTLLALLLLPVSAASAQATFATCQGAFITAGMVDWGTWTYPGGNTHVRELVGTYEQVMPGSDPRCNGSNTVVTNANWDAYGVGPSWGTFHVVPNQYSNFTGGWAGAWTGMSYADGTSSIRVEGHGYGDLEGQQVFVEIEFPGLFAPGTASGYILDPHGG